MKKNSIGIMGGMGPEADEIMQAHLRKECDAPTDQEQLSIVVVKNSDISDRTAAILDKGPSPLEEMTHSLRILEHAQVRWIVMACNTAHFFIDELQKRSSVPFVNMIDATVHFLNENFAGKNVLLLATTGTVQTHLYDTYIEKSSLNLILPNAEQQEQNVHASIYGNEAFCSVSAQQTVGIKAGEYIKSSQLLIQTIQQISQKKRIDAVILGCTELPIVQQRLENHFTEITFVDPMRIVAQKIVSLVKAEET